MSRQQAASTGPRGYIALTDELRDGRLTPSIQLEECLATIARWEPTVGAFVAMDEAAARRQAGESTERWAAGAPLSAIDGMPFAVKDVIETADLPTGQGSPLWAGTTTGRDAATVHALRAAGAVLVGKTTTTEFAGVHPFHATRNPRDLRRTPGGSSSGSAAAVAAGMVPLAIGTQVIGSILRPASYCGVIGFKPTVGAINRGGSFDVLSQSCHGVLAATLADAWHAMLEIAARVGGDPGHASLRGEGDLARPEAPPRLAVIESGGWVATGAAIRAQFESALRRLTTAGVEVCRRDSDAGIEALEATLDAAMDDSMLIGAWESRWPLDAYAARAPDQLSQHVRERLARARTTTETEYRAALARRDAARLRHRELSARYDALVTLAATGVAPLGLDNTGDPRMNVFASYLGAPALSLPLLEHEGLPLGLQFVGAIGEDHELFSLAGWLATEVFGSPHLVGNAPQHPIVHETRR